MPDQPKPLHGIKVVEFTHMVMGPAVGVILADLGADVIKVEPLEGDNTRRLQGSGAVAPAGVKPDEVMATLEKLAGLKTRGIITEDEFAAKKAELLKKLA